MKKTVSFIFIIFVLYRKYLSSVNKMKCSIFLMEGTPGGHFLFRLHILALRQL